MGCFCLHLSSNDTRSGLKTKLRLIAMTAVKLRDVRGCFVDEFAQTAKV